MAIVTPLDTPPGARRRLRLSSPATLEPIDEICAAPGLRPTPHMR